MKMRKRLFASMALLTAGSLLVGAILLCFIYYYQFRDIVQGEMQTTRSIWELFSQSLPGVVGVVLVILLAEYMLSKRLARRLVAPISKMDLTGELSAPYDEFAPFVLALERQQKRIVKHKEDLEKRADTITAIMENMNEGVIMVDHSGAVLSINTSAAKIFDVMIEAEGKNVLEIVRDVVFLKNVRAALSGTHSEMMLQQGGRVYQVFLSPVRDNGGIILFLDVTERVMAEKQRRDFSANVSHELKTPLTTIYGQAEMLTSGMVSDEDTAQFYGRIKDEAARMISLVEDILKLSRLDEVGGRETELREDVDLRKVAAEAIESLTEKAVAHRVEVVLQGEEGRVSANRSQMYEMFFNLIDNAIAYNRPEGKVRVTISYDAGQLRDTGLAEVVISDTGIGIPQEAQSRVFERFYRVDPSRSKKTGGTGLGLAIVKHIVSAHGGVVSIQSQRQKGTVMTVVLPGKP